MIAKFLRRTVLLSGILILSMGGPSAWAGANKANSPTKPELFIREAFVTFANAACSNKDTVTILGVGFLNGYLPVVVLGGVGSLVLCSSPSDSAMLAALPADLLDGDYRREVITGNGVINYDAYDLTIGAVGPQGEQGKIGPQGATGPKGIVSVTVRSSNTVTKKNVTSGSVFSACVSPEIRTGCGGRCFIQSGGRSNGIKDFDIGPSRTMGCQTFCLLENNTGANIILRSDAYCAQ